MTDITANTIAIETAMERLRQERETFEQDTKNPDHCTHLAFQKGQRIITGICGGQGLDAITNEEFRGLGRGTGNLLRKGKQRQPD